MIYNIFWKKKRFIFFLFFGILSVIFLNQCTILPLYQKPELENVNQNDLLKKLSLVYIKSPTTHFEQYLYKELSFLLDKIPEKDAETLKTAPSLKIVASYKNYLKNEIDIGDTTAHQGRPTVTQIQGLAYYLLESSSEKGNKILYKSRTFHSQTSIYRSLNAYASQIEAKEAEKRVAQDLSKMLLLDLTGYMSKNTEIKL